MKNKMGIGNWGVGVGVGGGVGGVGVDTLTGDASCLRLVLALGLLKHV